MAGYHIVEMLETFPKIVLLNTQEPTHVTVGSLDLALATVALVERIRWCVEGTLTSDHCGTVTTVLVGDPVPMPHHNNQAFQNALAHLDTMNPTE